MTAIIKKTAIWIMAIAVVLAMGLSTMAFADTAAPSAGDTGTITAKDVEEGATVTAYKIVKADYNSSGFTGYSAVDGVTIANVTKPTAAEITKIAGGDLSGLAKVGMTGSGTTYTATVNPGTYLIVVSGTGSKIYNPMVASVYYSVGGSDNTMTSGTVSANDKWNTEGTDAFAKSSTVDITKKIVNPSSNNEHGDDAAVGDDVSYSINTTMPSYPDNYKSYTFKITDTLSAGLTNNNNATVKVGGSTVAAGTDTYTLTYNGQEMTVNFADKFIKANGNKSVEVDYTAKVNSSATVNFDKNTNTATLTYTHNPQGETGSKESKTYHYTFDLDGNVNGSQTANNRKTHEVIKVNEKGEVESQTFESSTSETTVTNALAGAEFTLYKEDGTTAVQTKTTTANGYMNFTGLDAGTYKLKETKAPSGYTVNNTEHTVVIAPTYNANGTLASYTVTIDGQATSTYTASYTGDTITKIEPTTTETTYLKNSKLGNLPSTGGMGTYIFTILGIAIIAVAAALLFSRRKRGTNQAEE